MAAHFSVNLEKCAVSVSVECGSLLAVFFPDAFILMSCKLVCYIIDVTIVLKSSDHFVSKQFKDISSTSKECCLDHHRPVRKHIHKRSN